MDKTAENQTTTTPAQPSANADPQTDQVTIKPGSASDSGESIQGGEGQPAVVVDIKGDGSPPSLPVAVHARDRRKWRQRQQEAEKSAEAVRQENELLRLQLQALQSPASTTPTLSQDLIPPTLESCNGDDAEYQKRTLAFQSAIQQRIDDGIAQRDRRMQTNAEGERLERKYQTARAKYYDAAAKLGVRDFETKDEKFFEIFGEQAANVIIDAIPDSHLLAYYLGTNPDRAMEYASLVEEDATKALASLAILSRDLEVKRSDSGSTYDPNTAPAGGKAPSGDRQHWQRLVDQARQRVANGETDSNPVLQIKREARAAGVELD